MAPRYDPRVNLEYYTREAIRNADVWTDSAVRAEYSRLRDIAQKRLKQISNRNILLMCLKMFPSVCRKEV